MYRMGITSIYTLNYISIILLYLPSTVSRLHVGKSYFHCVTLSMRTLLVIYVHVQQPIRSYASHVRNDSGNRKCARC